MNEKSTATNFSIQFTSAKGKRWRRKGREVGEGKEKGGRMGKRVPTANADGTVESHAKVERAPR